MYVNSLEIKNYKGMEQAEFVFNAQMTALIGDNGSGKTCILDALSFALATYFRGVDGIKNIELKSGDKRQVIMANRNKEVKLPLSIGLAHTLAGQPYQWCRSTDKAAGNSTTYSSAKSFIAQVGTMVEQVRDGQMVDLPLLAYYGIDRLSNAKLGKEKYAPLGSRLDGYHGALEPELDQLKFLAWFKSYEDSVLKFGEDKTLYDAFVNTITTMVPAWSNISFSWEIDDLLGQLENGQWMAYQNLSSGFKGIVRLAADIAYRAIILNPHLGIDAVKNTKGVVLVDELDMHLHPKWQKQVIEDLKLAFPNIQFIVTTHSPFIVQSLRANEVINLAGQVSEDPCVKGIEDIAEDVMALEDVQRSHKFLEMQHIAARYFDLIEQGKTSQDDGQTAQLKAELDEIELQFSQDPVYVALMQAERKSELT
jgi:predicted ATP-binding protein involved in virulence